VGSCQQQRRAPPSVARRASGDRIDVRSRAVAQQLGSPIAAGKAAELFLFGTGVLKLTRRAGDRGPAEREAANLAAVAPLGLAPAPGPIVEIGGRWGLVMERIAAPTLGEA